MAQKKSASQQAADRTEREALDILQYLQENSDSLFSGQSRKMLAKSLVADSDRNKDLKELCKIWAGCQSPDRPPLAAFIKFLETVWPQEKSLSLFCSREKRSGEDSPSLNNASRLGFIGSLSSLSSVLSPPSSVAGLSAHCEGQLNAFLALIQTKNPLDYFLKNYLAHTFPQNASIDTKLIQSLTGLLRSSGSRDSLPQKSYKKFSRLLDALPSEPAWAPEWSRLIVADTAAYSASVSSLFEPAYRTLTELRTQQAEARRDSLRRSALLTRLVRLLRARREASLLHALLNADSLRAGYPPLDGGILYDPLRGHWDLWPAGAATETQVMAVEGGLMARNPLGDVQDFPVCIDFGTSSTVVALRERGRRRLLRVGVRDWGQAPRARHFENPTALEFVDAAAFGAAWQAEEWRPHVSWQTLKCSHQAREEMLSSPDAAAVYSGLTDIKTWARRNARGTETPLRDQRGAAFLLSPAAARERAAASPPAFNPLEIYAFHLGLAINSQYRENGRIHDEYYLSFPVAFDTPTRQCIAEGFRRGLERSLPASLMQQEAWRARPPLRVYIGADEPVAYAAGILTDSGLEPVGSGLPFGVFDFGGGTTDFAFGLYRWATPEEEAANGWESVIQLLDVAGEPQLGGEALLHLLCFALVCDNLDTLLHRGAGIPFLLPPGEISPAGGETIFTDCLPARANTIRLCEALRPLWENGKDAFDPGDEGILRVTLKDRSGADMGLVSLKADADALTDILRGRIRAAVESFFLTFCQAFKVYDAHPSEPLHIFPAGNACRSPLVEECFHAVMADIAARHNLAEDFFRLHAPRLPDDASPEALTIKTGVALGLLNAIPGEGLGIVYADAVRDPDSLFRFSLGTFRRGRLVPVLSRHTPVGQWQELGMLRADVTLTLGHSASPQALEGGVVRGECAEHRLSWPGEEAGHPVFIRALSADRAEVALDVSPDCPDGRQSRVLLLDD